MDGIRPGIAASLRRRAARWLALLLGLGLCLLGLVAVSNRARDSIRDRERYTIAFADIQCLPPPDQDRADFLAEVQYLSEMPSRLHLLDQDLTARLAAAFASHPRVEKVERVEIVPPRQVQVRLVYRNLHPKRSAPDPMGKDPRPVASQGTETSR
jgi:hypothetical protein